MELIKMMILNKIIIMIKIKHQQISDNINIMQQYDKYLTHAPISHNPTQSCQQPKQIYPSNHNHLQEGQIKSYRSLSKGRKWKKHLNKQRAPSQVLKDNLLKNRHMKRVNSLRQITQDNLKLFMRLQQQKSTYNFTKLHKQLSTSILPLTKSKIVNHRNQQINTQQNSAQYESRCSTTRLLKVKCQQMKQNFKDSQSQSKLNILVSQQSSQILASRTTSKISIFTEKVPQNGHGMAKQGLFQMPHVALKPKEQSIILKKIGIKIPSDKENIYSSQKGQIAHNKSLKIKFRPQSSIGMRQRGFLTQRKLNQHVQV